MRTRKVWMPVFLAGMLASPAALHAQQAPAVPAAPAPLLQAIPADATAFLAIRNLREFDTNVTGLLQQLGLPPGLLPGPLDLVRTRLGIARGLNENGGLAVIVLNLEGIATSEGLDQRLAVLIPATNEQEVIESLQGPTAEGQEGELYRVTLMGQRSLAAPRDGFVVVAQTAEAVRAVLQPQAGDISRTMSPDRIREFAARDIFAWINPRTISKELRQELQDGLAALMAQGVPGADPSEMFEQFEKAIDQSREFALGITLSRQAGLVISWYANMRPDTELGRQMAAARGSERSLLMGLPNEPPVLALGMIVEGGDQIFQTQVQQSVEQVLGLAGEMMAGPVDPQRLQQLQAPITRLVTAMRHVSVLISVLPVEDQKGLIGLAKVIQAENPAQWRTDARSLFEQIKQIIVDAAIREGEAEEQVKAVADAIEWRENAEQVEGAAVDHIVVDLDKLQQAVGDDLEQEDISAFRRVAGPEGLLFRLAVVGDQHIVATFGGGPQRFSRVAGHARQGDAPLAQSRDLQRVADRQPAGPRMVEGYLSIANLLAMVTNVAAELDQMLPIPPMRNAAPITLTSVKVGDTAQHSEVLVPIELIQSVKDAVGPLMMMMMGGGMEPDDDDDFEPDFGSELN